MSKNFTEAEGRRYKGVGFHVPQPKLRFSFVSKNHGVEPFSIFQYFAPSAISSFLNHVNVDYLSR